MSDFGSPPFEYGQRWPMVYEADPDLAAIMDRRDRELEDFLEKLHGNVGNLSSGGTGGAFAWGDATQDNYATAGAWVPWFIHTFPGVPAGDWLLRLSAGIQLGGSGSDTTLQLRVTTVPAGSSPGLTSVQLGGRRYPMPLWSVIRGHKGGPIVATFEMMSSQGTTIVYNRLLTLTPIKP